MEDKEDPLCPSVDNIELIAWMPVDVNFVNRYSASIQNGLDRSKTVESQMAKVDQGNRRLSPSMLLKYTCVTCFLSYTNTEHIHTKFQVTHNVQIRSRKKKN
ncbi:hypothetical protein M8J76_016722 [Diaphorina citri]|nr:hypothetical protein M8J75_016104 [Diaphorina citri]KAI5750564.1 hypothetical protein M8J76_016722 [Diaphorina citri]